MILDKKNYFFTSKQPKFNFKQFNMTNIPPSMVKKIK